MTKRFEPLQLEVLATVTGGAARMPLWPRCESPACRNPGLPSPLPRPWEIPLWA